MAQINTVDALGVFTQALVELYKEILLPKGLLRSLFKTKETGAKIVSIEVQRGTEYVAVDVMRGTEGNRNSMSKSTLKMIMPPFYKEWFDATELDFYDILFGGINATVDEDVFSNWLETVSEKLQLLQAKIERATELQCAQVLQTGIVLLNSDTNIDFKRKSASIVDVGAAAYWSASTGDPAATAKNACEFLRTVGKAQGGVFNMFCGDLALAAMLNNENFQAKADLKDAQLSKIGLPQQISESTGGVLHGQLSAGSWIVNIWTYPEYYETSGGVMTPYIDPKNIIVVPMQPKFTLAYGGIPHIMRDKNNAEFPEYIAQQKGAYALNNYVDPRMDKHIFDIKSAPIAIPTAVDQIYTAQVLA